MRRARTALPALVAALAIAVLGPAHSAEPPDLGFPRHPPELRERLAVALAARGPDVEARTEHRRPDGSPRFTNRLLLESSPYLRQHAHNPVDWYAWGEEALAAAVREDKPIFLSIGYSTCHWCHVMERESFDDLGIASLLGESFIAIKVDREERPDLDDIYMTAMLLTGRGGGWPLQSFLLPSGRPFFSTTYLPRDRFAAVLGAVAQRWRDGRAEIEVTAASLTDAVREVTAARAEAVTIGADAAARATADLLKLEDAANGGLGSAPKFPQEPELLFLLDQAARGASADAGRMAERALDGMARGGIFDQVGGGFHRYATDAAWRVPHFEKMLYNQAQLARVYLAGYRLTGRPSFRRAAEQTLDYVLREMTSPEGGFYSATDADSDGAEGRFFVWTPAELERALGAADAAWIATVFGVTVAGNFEDGRTVLHLPRPLDVVARDSGTTLAATLDRLDRARERLRAERSRRNPPLRDDKVLTGWNGMMVAALAEGHATLGHGRWLDAATRAADLLWTVSRRSPGRWWRVRLDGASNVAAMLEDHACYAEGLLALHDATGERRFLDRAVETIDGMLDQFWDGQDGGFFIGPSQAGETLIARPKSPQDGATPSANGTALRVLAMAYQRTGEVRYRERADALLGAFSGLVQQSPSSFTYLLLGRAELESADTGTRRYAARGKVAIDTRVEPAGTGIGPARLVVGLDIAPGWHVNSSAPLEESLIATSVGLDPAAAGWRLERVVYPRALEVRLGFQESPLSVYTGRVAMSADLARTDAADATVPVPVVLRLQACDDRVCLRPEELTLRVPAAAILRSDSAPF
jgi:uncharacterized protein YyaL (SSP411 family)